MTKTLVLHNKPKVTFEGLLQRTSKDVACKYYCIDFLLPSLFGLTLQNNLSVNLVKGCLLQMDVFSKIYFFHDVPCLETECFLFDQIGLRKEVWCSWASGIWILLFPAYSLKIFAVYNIFQSKLNYVLGGISIARRLYNKIYFSHEFPCLETECFLFDQDRTWERSLCR